MASTSPIPIDFTESTSIHMSHSTSPKRVFKIDQQLLPTTTTNSTATKKKGKGPNGECCNCGGENCDKKEKITYSDW